MPRGPEPKPVPLIFIYSPTLIERQFVLKKLGSTNNVSLEFIHRVEQIDISIKSAPALHH